MKKKINNNNIPKEIIFLYYIVN